jgi:hypothetical protein
MIKSVAALVIVLLAAAPPVAAWGFEAHQFIVERAIELLPAPMRPFYEKHRDFIVAHTIDPDLWRTIGFTEENPNHQLDLDAEAYGRSGSELPREYGAAIEKFGPETLARHGLLPWRTAEVYGRLKRAFEEQKKGGTRFSIENLRFYSAIVAHYVADAHVPFHATVNYDGQKTDQIGIHARFESELFNRYESQLSIKPPAPAPITAPRDLIFARLTSGLQLVEPLLAADRAALGTREEYDDEYYEAFFGRARPVLERRLNESISAVAGVFIGAWQAAGRPELPLNLQRSTQRVRKTVR